MRKAVFLDRDGTINEIVYYQDLGIVDSPFTAEQFKLLPQVGEAIRILNQSEFKVILVSNQPGIAKGHFSMETFEVIRKKMRTELAKHGALLDAEYYCLHHPEVKNKEYKKNCECRKPKKGLLLRAAKDLNINLSNSWMVGDGLTDIEAGKKAGCKTILIGRMKCELCRLMDEKNTPDYIVKDLYSSIDVIKKEV
ncbi:MAG TPA: HAD family hydrolase [Thermotogaceae bacterium]|nr:HAD family hydrolase [Thermotogaceae bacterium]